MMETHQQLVAFHGLDFLEKKYSEFNSSERQLLRKLLKEAMEIFEKKSLSDRDEKTVMEIIEGLKEMGVAA